MAHPDPMSLNASDTILARVRARIDAQGLSWAELSRRSNRSHTYWLRKLEPASASGERKLAVQDLDELEAALGLAPGELLDPPLSQNASNMLERIRAGGVMKLDPDNQADVGDLMARGIVVVVRNRVRLAA